MKDTTSDFRFDQKLDTYDKHLNALTRLIDTRIEVISDTVQQAQLREGIAAVKLHQRALADSTLRMARTPTQDNVDRMAAELQAMLQGLNQIAAVMKQGPAKSRSGLEHELLLFEHLDRLAAAVKAGEAQAAADAARRLAQEIQKMQNAEAQPDADDEEAKRRARAALLAATNNLRAMTGDLVRTAKDAISNPQNVASQDAMQVAMQNMRAQVNAASEAQRQLDTVHTHTANSGIVDAAARAAQELQEMFK